MTTKFFIYAVIDSKPKRGEIFMEEYFSTMDEAREIAESTLLKNSFYTGDYQIIKRTIDEESFFVEDVSVYDYSYEQSEPVLTRDYLISINEATRRNVLERLSTATDQDLISILNQRVSDIEDTISKLNNMTF